jgi:hypothetical protein
LASSAQSLIEEVLHQAADPVAERDLRQAVTEHVRKLKAAAGSRDRESVVEEAERVVRANPERAFAFDAPGVATLTAGGGTWCAGRFETPSIEELRARVRAGRGVARLWVFEGRSPATDIGGLQATTDNQPLFQVASQFNCLEAPRPTVVPVAYYFADPTQGPRAAVSAFPATLLRHYAAPGEDGKRFAQATDRPQVDLLADVFAPRDSPVKNGYLRDSGELTPDAVVAALEKRFERIQVGTHVEAEVVLGYDWYGAVDNSDQRRIAQAFTSTVAGGGYGGDRAFGSSFEPACRQLLRAGYLGTLLAAITLGRSPVVLTLIGGSAFHNSLDLIWESIMWAFDQIQRQASGTLDVIVNAYDFGGRPEPETLVGDVRSRGGVVLRFNMDGLTRVDR